MTRGRLGRAALGLILLPGCGGEAPPPRSDTGPTVLVAENASTAAFEGMGAVATFLSAAGTDFSGATVEAEDAGLVVLEQRCAAAGCAVVLGIADSEPDRGSPLPPAIDAQNRFLRIRRSGAADHRATVPVLALDAIRNDGDTARVRGVFLASSLESTPETTFRGVTGMEPVRWIVFGDATLRGTVDVSGDASGPGPGGLAGATSGAASGAGAGGAGSASAGAGGGGSAEDGEPGEGEGAGAGGASFSPGCAADPFGAACGGGGGGAADGAGGAGGGTFQLIVLGELDVDANVLARGHAGAGGGGGGGGGRVFVAASQRTGAGARIDVSGGPGGARAGAAGGAGGAGESGGDELEVEAAGPWITADAAWTVRGRAAAGAAVRVESLDGTMLGDTTAGADGRFAVEVTLSPGLNRLRVIASDTLGEHRAWQGNHFELERRGTTALPVGGLLDVVYLP